MTTTIPGRRLGDTFDDALAEDVWAVVQSVQAGDTAAYGQLYSRYHDSVYRFVHHRIKNTTIAEDITSAVFEKGLRSIGKFAWQGRDFGAWLTTIARNLTIDHHKSGFYHYECPAFEEVMTREDPDDSATADDTIVADELYQTLLAAMARLLPEQRQVLILRCLNELSVRETAAAMSKQEGAVKALTFRATASMRRILGPDFDLHLPAPRRSS